MTKTDAKAAEQEAPDLSTFADDDEDLFDSPAPATFFRCADHNDALVLVEVESHETGVKTTNGDSEAIRCTIHVVDNPDGDVEDTGETYESVLLFGKMIVPSLKRRIGKKVLCRIGQGDKKPGQNAPWILNDATGDPDAVAAARALRKRQREAADPFNK